MTAAGHVVIALAATGLLSGCSVGAIPSKESGTRHTPALPAGGLLIQGAGATFPSPLYLEWFRRYQADHPTVVIAYDAVGSGEGIRRFLGRAVPDDEKVDFGASDAALQDQEIATLPGGALLLPLPAP